MGIELSKVTYAYYVPKKSKEPIRFTLNDINLKLDSNDEFIAIVGHTGSGKSTLVQMFNALRFPSSGTVNINDKYRDLDTEFVVLNKTVIVDIKDRPSLYKYVESPKRDKGKYSKHK